MAEIWGAAIAVGGAVISGYAQQKQAKEASQERKASTKEEAKYTGILSQFEAQQADYYNQLNRQRKQRGLDQFKQFTRTGTFAPEFSGGNNTIDPGVAPDINKLLPAEPVKAPKKKRSLFDKISDPLDITGGKQSKINDPLNLFGG